MKTLIITPAYSHAHHALHAAVMASGLPWMPLYNHSDLVRARGILLTSALARGAETLVLVDADTIPGEGVLEAIAAEATPERAVFGIYTLRDGRLSIEPRDPATAEVAITAGQPLPIVYGGLGLCAIHRASLEVVALTLPLIQEAFVSWRPFCLPFVADGIYHADDRSLCARLLAAGVELVANPRLRVAHAVTRLVDDMARSA